MQLQKDSSSIAAAGIQVVGVSYDNVEILSKFAKKKSVEFPLLADPKSEVIKQFGLLNETGKPGTRTAGMSYPLTVLVDKNGVVRAKLPATVVRRHNGNQLVDAWTALSKSTANTAVPAALNFTVKNISGKEVALKDYLGKVVVVVNVASKCGYTPQYEPLQKLHEQYKDKGLAILGFPCNQFGGQEPGTEKDIKEFCEATYGVKFDMFSKLDVKGQKQAPLYKYLTAQDTKPAAKGDVKWNFEKFVIDRNGKVVGRFATRVAPDGKEFSGLLAKLLMPKAAAEKKSMEKAAADKKAMEKPAPAKEKAGDKKTSWRQFNGSQGHAVGAGPLPTEWSETKNVAWKTPVPGSGWSSPIVDGDEVWLTTAIDEEHSLRAVCIDAVSGKVRLDVEVFKPKKLLVKHDRNGHATPTPVLDDDHIYVHFGSYGTAALKRSNGDIVWTNQDTKINHQWGPGSSPVLFEDMVVFNCDGMEQRYVTALNKKTGKQVWKTPRSETITKGGFFRKAFSTPSVVTVNGSKMLLSAGANQVSTFDPKTGKAGWSVKYFGYAGVTKPIIADGRAFVTSGYGDAVLMAVQLSDSGSKKSGELLWKTKRGAPIIPSPIVVGTELYMVSDKGVLSCLDAATGKVHWQDRLPGNYAASITFGDGKLFVHNDKGLTTVFAPSVQGFEKLATNQLDSNIQASPALISGAIYLRTKNSLYRIQKG